MSVEYLLWELENGEDDQDRGGADGQVGVGQNQARPFQKEQDLHSIPGPRFLYRVVKGHKYLKAVRSIISLEKQQYSTKAQHILRKGDSHRKRQRVHRYIWLCGLSVRIGRANRVTRIGRGNSAARIYSPIAFINGVHEIDF